MRQRSLRDLFHTQKRRSTSESRFMTGLAIISILGISALVVVFFEQTGGTFKKTTSVQSLQQARVGGFTERVSLQTVSNAETQKISTDLKSAVPNLQELFVQRMKDGGVSIVATSSLRGLPQTYLTAADDATRYLLSAYRLPGIKVDFAAIYIENGGRYIMAAGLGAKEAKSLALSTFALDQGVQFVHELATVDRYTHTLTTQAFAQYQSS